jgi:hypothetical protein
MTDFEDITKENQQMADESLEHKYNHKDEKIHGWLTFFLFVIGLGAIITVIYGLANLSLANYDTGQGYWMSVAGAGCDVILFLGMGVLGIYTIVSFYKYKPNAVALGKAYLIFAFSSNLITLLSGEFDTEGLFTQKRIIYHLFWGIIWFWYLCQSKQVNSLFPKVKRKMYKQDKILLFSTVTPCIIWVISIFSLAFFQEYKINEFTINENELSINEYTDERIIFEKPWGLTVEKQYNDTETYFSLSHEDKIAITLYSVYDNNDAQEYFNECMQSWRDKDLDDFEYDIIDETHYISNGNSIYQKTLQYNAEPVIEWSFVVMFNKETEKCCVISYFSVVEIDYLSKLITSIRFKL